jgi:LPS-assembly protein
VKLAGIDQDAGQLPSDITDRDKFDGWRGSIETKGLFSLSSWWKTGWDVTIESDDAFRRFYKLDNILLTDRVNRGFLVGQSERNYFGLNVYQLGGLLLNDQPEADSWIHPVIDYNYVAADPVLGGELRWNTNVLSLSRDNEDVGSGQESLNRIVTEVKWRKRLTDHIGITYTPFGELRGDIYQLKDYNDPQAGSLDNGVIVDGSTSLARGLAFGGVTVAYPWVANSSRGSHVIEPIGQIIGRQNSVRQRDLPDEDAQSLVFDDTNLFETTKFSGYDRIETGSRANVGVQYTFQANSGGYVRILGGQSFHLSGDNPYANPGFDQEGNPVFTPTNGLETDRSDYVLGAYLAPSDFFRIISQSRFDDDDFALRRQDTTAIVGYGPFYATGTYSYEANALAAGFTDAQQDVLASLNMALTEHWSVKGGLRYDIDQGEMLQNLVQVRYADECFVLVAQYTDNRFENDEIADGKTLMLRFELKHIGSFGYKTDALDYAFSEQQSGE